jgi:hypothetical protein
MGSPHRGERRESGHACIHAHIATSAEVQYKSITKHYKEVHLAALRSYTHTILHGHFAHHIESGNAFECNWDRDLRRKESENIGSVRRNAIDHGDESLNNNWETPLLKANLNSQGLSFIAKQDTNKDKYRQELSPASSVRISEERTRQHTHRT